MATRAEEKQEGGVGQEEGQDKVRVYDERKKSKGKKNDRSICTEKVYRIVCMFLRKNLRSNICFCFLVSFVQHALFPPLLISSLPPCLNSSFFRP